MLTLDQVKLVGIPKNVSRLNNYELTPAALYNDSVNLYQAVKLILAETLVSAGGTDLDNTQDASTVLVSSSTGLDTTIPAATEIFAGVMSAADKIKLDNLQTLVGVTTDNLGTFTGALISDDSTIKNALQELETEIENLVLGIGTNDLSESTTETTVVITPMAGTSATIETAVASASDGTGGNAGIVTNTDKYRINNAVLSISNGTDITGSVSIGTNPITKSYTLSIASNAVTNTKLADMPALTIKGNDTGSTDNPKDLTVAEVVAMLGISGGGSSDGNGIYSGSGTIPASTISTTAGTFNIDSANVAGRTIKIGNVTGAGSRTGIEIDSTYLKVGKPFSGLNFILFNSDGTNVYGSAGNNLHLNGSGGGELSFAANFVITDSGTNGGIKYSGDYSATYTNRSLVDKQYVDDTVATATAEPLNIITLTSGASHTIGTYRFMYAPATTGDVDFTISSSMTEGVLYYIAATLDGSSTYNITVTVGSGVSQYWLGSHNGIGLGSEFYAVPSVLSGANLHPFYTLVRFGTTVYINRSY